jgi:hypothetical protein
MPIPPASEFTRFVKYRADIRIAVDTTYRFPARTYLARPPAGLLTSFVRQTQVAQSSGLPEVVPSTPSGPTADLVLNWKGLTVGLEEQYNYVSGDYGQLPAFSPCKKTFSFTLTNIQNIGDVNSITLTVDEYDFTGLTIENVSVSEGYVIVNGMNGILNFATIGLTNSSVFTITLPDSFDDICQITDIGVSYLPISFIAVSCETQPTELNTNSTYVLINPSSDKVITIILGDGETSNIYSIYPGQALGVNGESQISGITELSLNDCSPAKTLSCRATSVPFDVSLGLQLYNQEIEQDMTLTFNNDATLVINPLTAETITPGPTSVVDITCSPV